MRAKLHNYSVYKEVMSYNTRRTIGRGGQTTQVNYHQSMSGRPGHRGGSYSNYSQSSYSSSHSSGPQGYSSQQKAVQPPPVTKAPSPAPTPAPVTASAPAPPVPTPVAPPAAQQSTQPAAPTPVPPPIQNTSPAEGRSGVKTEPGTPGSPLETQGSMDVDTNGEGGGDVHITPKPHWPRRGPSFKVSKKIKRRRMNARLRRLLVPKNALMVLNELHPGVKFSVQEQKNALHQYFCTVQVEVEGKTYTGQGISRVLAKQTACENALKGLLLEKLAKADQEQQQQLPQPPTDDVEMDEEKNTSGGEGDSIISDSRPRRHFPEDDVPWGSLASFALHKLFTEWQSQGTEVPVAKMANSPVTGAPSPMKKIPDDANKRHPVQLLNQLRPGCQYRETREGNVPSLTFTISVTIDGVEYSGVGSTKKEAKKKCAQAALAPMGVIFDN